MAIDGLLADLRAAGVSLSFEGDRLGFDAPAGALSDDLLARMRADRDGLLAELRGGDPEPSGPVGVGDDRGDVAESAAVGDPAEPEPPADLIRCPWCPSAGLSDDPGGLRCSSCGRLAWRATAEGGLVRADHAAGVAIDPAAVPACPSCGRWCDVLTLAEAWRCSGCDPEAPERRRRTLRVIGLVSRSRGLSVRGVRPGA